MRPKCESFPGTICPCPIEVPQEVHGRFRLLPDVSGWPCANIRARSVAGQALRFRNRDRFPADRRARETEAVARALPQPKRPNQAPRQTLSPCQRCSTSCPSNRWPGASYNRRSSPFAARHFLYPRHRSLFGEDSTHPSPMSPIGKAMWPKSASRLRDRIGGVRIISTASALVVEDEFRFGLFCDLAAKFLFDQARFVFGQEFHWSEFVTKLIEFLGPHQSDETAGNQPSHAIF